MAHTTHLIVDSVVVEEEIDFSLQDLCRVCRVDRAQLIALVEEGVLAPSGAEPDSWLFAGPSLKRARVALRLSHDLELSGAATALVLDLMDRLHTLESKLRRAGLA